MRNVVYLRSKISFEDRELWEIDYSPQHPPMPNLEEYSRTFDSLDWGDLAVNFELILVFVFIAIRQL